MSDEPIISEVVLERARYYFRRAIRAAEVPQLGDARLEVFLDREISNLVFQFEFQLTSKVLGERSIALSVSYPDGWWNALKERWFPRWLLRLVGPVRYRCESVVQTVESLLLFPDLPVPASYDHVPSRAYQVARKRGGPLKIEIFNALKEDPVVQVDPPRRGQP